MYDDLGSAVEFTSPDGFRYVAVDLPDTAFCRPSASMICCFAAGAPANKCQTLLSRHMICGVSCSKRDRPDGRRICWVREDQLPKPMKDPNPL